MVHHRLPAIAIRLWMATLGSTNGSRVSESGLPPALYPQRSHRKHIRIVSPARCLADRHELVERFEKPIEPESARNGSGRIG